MLVATAVADLLPEAHQLVGRSATLEIGVDALAGFIAFSLIEAFIHQSSFEHEHAAHEAHEGELHAPRDPRSVLALLPPVSLIIHSTLDGLAIGLGFQASTAVGMVVLMAVLAHDFADGMNVVTLVFEAARGGKLAGALLLLDALAPVIGAWLSLWFSIPPATVALLLAWFAGAFLAIGAGHLLPEAQHQNPQRGHALVGLSAVGAVIVLAVRSAAE